MVGYTPFGGPEFDDENAFVQEHLPEPGSFLKSADILTGDRHVAVHTMTRELFEERTVYDPTFGYNLARLNEDPRHSDAGYRYAEDDGTLRAEFTPTTPFCPQTATLAVASFRAWNGLDERHGYELVRVRIAPMHNRSAAVNDRIEALKQEYRKLDELPDAEGTKEPTTSEDLDSEVPSSPF